MKRILVIGGGLAGLSATVHLASQGVRVTLLESKNRLGGRAGSFTDAQTGQLVDACQHVSMGCCTEFDHFCRALGIDHYFARQPALHFMTSDGQVSTMQADRLPAPFHLSRSFWRAHYLTTSDRLRIAWGLLCLRLMRPGHDEPLLPWLLNHRQTERTIRRFWEIVLVSALNDSIARVGTKYARKVFVDAFMNDRRGFDVMIPTTTLGEIYGGPIETWLQQHHVELKYQNPVKSLEFAAGQVKSVTARDGTIFNGYDAYVLAIPWARVAELVPGQEQLNILKPSPITSVHLWYDRPVTTYPHLVFIETAAQWMFNRGEVAPGEHYIQIVISSSADLGAAGNQAIQDRIAQELATLVPGTTQAKLIRAKVVTEHQATFAPVPGIDAYRPRAATAYRNLFLAGDYTATNWPATMEGAVRSGKMAAQAIRQQIL